MKIRRNHVRKRYRYNVNRKTMNRTRSSTGKIKDPEMQKLWLEGKRVGTNFKEMGLASDPNKSVGIPNYKRNRLESVKIVKKLDDDELARLDSKAQAAAEEAQKPKRGHVVQELEQMAIDRRADPEFRLPKGVVKELTYFLGKHRFNYRAMVADRRNHGQWTWRQFRLKIRRFMAIPEQFNEYLKQRNLPIGVKPDWPEYDSDSEWK
ncbi:nucleolar protein 16 [Drosophila grimshawi]|uniref:Nucleolar protein 16 n=1 Tax=Drosophila grimshawi TaxID=7222 RepID=B4JH68_DROGR|nr:nucleolar protein 16 [Drosophila grimshawi]EDV92759.1 GH18650 [Drosophila grimshawi]